MKPFSQACENNKQPILNVLQRVFAHATSVLEIGSGTGQHAVFFAPNLPHLRWQTSDQPEYHEAMLLWIEDEPSANLHQPIPFTVGVDDWHTVARVANTQFDAVFTANTTHIMQVHDAELMLKTVAEHLPVGGIFCQYGPFNINGQYTSESNREFDESLKARGCGGIRDIAELEAWVANTGLTLVENNDLPANNRLLVWKKS